eukprot:2920881-Amphidinium_carterae.2
MGHLQGWAITLESQMWPLALWQLQGANCTVHGDWLLAGYMMWLIMLFAASQYWKGWLCEKAGYVIGMLHWIGKAGFVRWLAGYVTGKAGYVIGNAGYVHDWKGWLCYWHAGYVIGNAGYVIGCCF